MVRVGVCLALLGCTACAAPRVHFQQPRLLVAAGVAEMTAIDSAGICALRSVVREARCTLDWKPMEAGQLMEAVSLGEVDVGFVSEAAWDAGSMAADWIEASASRYGYRLLIGRGAGTQGWITRWEAMPARSR